MLYLNHNFRLVTYCIVVLLCLTACKKQLAVTPAPPLSSYFIEANIDGVKWRQTGNNAYFAIQKNIPPAIPPTMAIGGYDPNYMQDPYRSVSIYFSFVPQPGKYYFNNDDYLVPVNGISAGIDRWTGNIVTGKYSNSGYVIIESMDSNNIKGTFEFTAKNKYDTTDTTTVKITDGKFSVVNVGS